MNPYSAENSPERQRERAAELAELKALAFYMVTRPITVQSILARRDLVRRDAPRWRPDKAFARFVGDPAER